MQQHVKTLVQSDSHINYGLIIWKLKDGEYKCHLNNCDITSNYSLAEYMKTIHYDDEYIKLMKTKQTQINIVGGRKIIVQYINNDTIAEIRCPNDNHLNLLSCISHKIRNPLTNIVGILSLCEFKLSEAMSKKYMSILKKSSYDIVSIANDLIDILNLYNEEINISYEKININKLFAECKQIALANFNKQINIITKIDNVPDIIITDNRRLKQVLVNFINNAVVHTSDNNVTIGMMLMTEKLFKQSQNPFKYIHSNHPTYNLLFTIENTGTIDAPIQEYLDYILHINVSGQSQIEAKKIKGFGLLINRHLCNLMGGNIWYSCTDKTITFYFNVVCDCIVIE